MNIMTFISGGAILAVAVIYGLWTFDSRAKTEQLKAADLFIGVVQKDVAKAKAVNAEKEAAIKQLKDSVEDQKKAAADNAKKARAIAAQRDQLQRKIANAPASENVPIPDVLELVIDGLRRPVAGSGEPAADSSSSDQGGDAAAPAGPVVPPEAGPTS